MELHCFQELEALSLWGLKFRVEAWSALGRALQLPLGEPVSHASYLIFTSFPTYAHLALIWAGSKSFNLERGRRSGAGRRAVLAACCAALLLADWAAPPLHRALGTACKSALALSGTLRGVRSKSQSWHTADTQQARLACARELG